MFADSQTDMPVTILRYPTGGRVTDGVLVLISSSIVDQRRANDSASTCHTCSMSPCKHGADKVMGES